MSIDRGKRTPSVGAGLADRFRDRQQKHLVPAIAGGVGFLLLLWLKSGSDDAVLKQGSGMIQVSYGKRFWLAFILFIGTASLNGYQYIENRGSSLLSMLDR